MVVDEAHCLKNPKGARYKNMDRFNTRRRLLLTGTPVQNSAKELMVSKDPLSNVYSLYFTNCMLL